MIHSISTKLSLLLGFCALLSGCGTQSGEGRPQAIEADYVISVFELRASGDAPCPALKRLESAPAGEGGWRTTVAGPNQLLKVLDCRPEGQDILIEETGRLLATGENKVGWELFLQQRSGGGVRYVTSGRGEGELFVGLEGGERVVTLELEVEHRSGSHQLEAPLSYEGAWPPGRALLLYKRISERANSPWLIVAMELY